MLTSSRIQCLHGEAVMFLLKSQRSFFGVLLIGALLLIHWLVVLPACGQEPKPSAERLEQDLEKAYAAKNYVGALQSAEKLLEIREGQRIEVLYRIAALHCLQGHKEETYSWLGKLFEAGFWQFPRLRQDGDFGCVRDEERFTTMWRQAWAKQYIAMLERPERESFQKPKEVMAALALRPGERVADIGAGSGYFTIPVAKAVGPTGIVWALDIRQEMLDYIAKRLEVEKLTNVKLGLVKPDDPLLPAAGVDTILLVDTLHYVQDRAAYAKKLRAGLAPGGRVVVIDYIPKPFNERPWGPTPEQQFSKEQIDRDMAAAGLKPVKVHTFLTEQYFVEYAVEESARPNR
jgi:ubiquinone/menaquinone biosynthesis C-methylase UbiE